MKPGSILKEKQSSLSFRTGLRPKIMCIYIVINCHSDRGTLLVYDFFDGKVKRALRDYMEKNYEVVA